MKKTIYFMMAAIAIAFAACSDKNEPITNITNNYGTNSGEITCSVNEANVLAKGGKLMVSVKSQASWEATVDRSWVTVSPTTGKGEAFVTITATGGTEGTATVLFTNGSNSTKVVIKRTATNDLLGKFSVSATDIVRFSSGNLQYQASTSTWRFAEEQYDINGYNNSNISDTYTNWIDLFGWGTGNAPTKKTTDPNDYSTFTDWGTNKISNGGNKADMWRTLTNDEWLYLFKDRTNAEKLFGLASVNNINGVIVLPDDWTQPAGVDFIPSCTKGLKWTVLSSYYKSYYDGSGTNHYGDNIYTTTQWRILETAGAVFLPAAGERSGTSVYDVGSAGFYWSDTPYDSGAAYFLYLTSNTLFPQNNFPRGDGFSVRLVQDVK